jgi:predicted metal-dependent phosphoesterase TrpH
MWMKIDLHVHSKDCSDGALCLDDIFKEASNRGIQLLSISDHDAIGCQERAVRLAIAKGISYLPGVEMSVQFSHPEYREGKDISLDFLGYGFNIYDEALNRKLEEVRKYREERAHKILAKLNEVFDEENRPRFTEKDLAAIQETVDGSFGRPHIANYLIEKDIVQDRQEAFDKYLERCNVSKYPMRLKEVSRLVRNAGGVCVFAHPNNNTGTSLMKYTDDLDAQSRIIEGEMLEHIDGIECWHSRQSPETTAHYVRFCEEHDLLQTGGTDCHQKPVIMGTLDIPVYVAKQFNKYVIK